MKRISILSIVLLYSITTQAQTGEIKGKVTDEKGEPVPFAIIVVINDEKGKEPTSTGTKADADGNYSLKGLKERKYNLMAKAIGRPSAIELDVSVKRNQVTIQNFTLEQRSITKKCVVITHSAKVRPPKLIDVYRPKESILSLEEIKEASARDHGSISSSSGGIIQSDKGGSLNTSGGRENSIVYFVDGIKQTGSPQLPANQISTKIIQAESYVKKPINKYKSVKLEPVSTFSIDVDKASYSNIRRMIMNKITIPEDAVRIEEMINYFDYQYEPPKDTNPIAVHTEYTTCPWETNHNLLKIGLKAKEINAAKRPASNLVFLIDVSGSMDQYNKLPLLIQSMNILVDQLTIKDKVSIVVYAGAAGLVLKPTSGDKKLEIKAALNSLNAGGSTAGGAGIQLAYEIAKENFISDGNNRVILATDGDFNVGINSDLEMERLIEEKRKSNVFLTCLGFGEGNYKDSKMETLANKGNGNYFYIDNISEARKCFEKDLLGTLITIAKDVKIQIEFNPQYVSGYRLVGYENRMLENEDFKNDKVDAGDLGSGHTVTAVYEIIPYGTSTSLLPQIDSLKYSTSAIIKNPELATIKFRYKKPNDSISKEMKTIVTSIYPEAPSDNFKFINAVSMFGLKLSASPYKDSIQINNILNLLNSAIIDNDRAEFKEIVELYTKN